MIWPFRSKAGKADLRSSGAPAALEFKSGKEALDFIAKWLRTDLAENQIVNGMISQPRWKGDLFIAPVLVPAGAGFQQVYTITAIKAYETPAEGRVTVKPSLSTEVLGLQPSDLVSVLIVKHAPELAPETEWLGSIMFKLDPVFDPKAGTWKIARKYEF